MISFGVKRQINLCDVSNGQKLHSDSSSGGWISNYLKGETRELILFNDNLLFLQQN